MQNITLTAMTGLLGRVALAAIFLLAGVNKIGAYAATQAYMESMGVPGILLPAVIALEIIGAVAVIAGFRARLAAIGLAAFSVLSALIFHFDLADQMQFILFFKNVAMAGGLLVLAANGPGALSLDARRAA
ncbi:MAG: DoxX family protein [Xanthomonadales bacterium]|jgi:putative oxidoreductase|nr:DoxX family protein [Xanthomonadales bacterium]